MVNKKRKKERERNESILEKLTAGRRTKKDFEKRDPYAINDQNAKNKAVSNFYHNIYEIESRNSILYPRYPDNNAVSTLYLCAIQSAFLHNSKQSLYEIFKNAESLIPDIIKSDEQPEKETFDQNVITEGKYKYFCMPLSSTHIMRSKECYGYISFYTKFIPTTHIDNMNQWETDILKQVKIIPFSKIESYLYSSSKKLSLSNLFRQWKQKVDDEKYVANLEPEFEKTAQIFAERAKTLPAEYVKRSTKYPLNKFSSIYYNLMTKRQSEALKEAAINLEIANKGYEISLPETSDLEYMFLQIALFWDRSIARTPSDTGKNIIEIGKLLYEFETPEERKKFYQFLGKMILEYDNKKPLLKTFIDAARENDAEIPFEIIFSLHGEKQVMHNSANPNYRQVLTNNFAKDIKVWYDGHI